MWFEITSHLSGFQMLWSLGNRTAGQQVDVFFNSDQTLRFELFGTTSITGPIPSLSTPHQVVVTYDQTTFTLYVDGVSVGTTTGGANITYGGAAIAAQASPVGNEAGCYGGEFSIYTSTLSAARVLAHYNKGVGLW